MKTINNICRYALIAAMVLALTFCNDDKEPPAQPGFIKVSLSATLVLERYETFRMYVDEDPAAERYEWNLPASLELSEGGGTAMITVTAVGEAGVVPAGSVSVIAYNAHGASYVRTFFKDITILAETPTITGYGTKRYGAKTWMTENLRDSGAEGDLGRSFNDDPLNDELYGRLYTWHEAMTGIPGCPAGSNPYVFGYSGIDDAGNEFTLDATTNGMNAQIRGICPEGWHIPNPYDWHDLLVGIKEDYNITTSSLAEVAGSMSGYIIGVDRDSPTTNKTLTNCGFVTAYLKGGLPNTQGGIWITTGTNNAGTTFTYTGNATFPNSNNYPLYMDMRTEVGFNALPVGRYRASTGVYEEMGYYSYHWSSFPNASGTLRYTTSYAGVNFSRGFDDRANGYNVRCVANY